MKKNFILALLLLFLASSLFAQTKTTVYGNLGVENVNISIVNTPYGTSTDAKGHYELPLFDRSETVNLYYSCIGYQDTVVSLTPRQLQRDSINISFRMRKMSYDLQEVGRLGKQRLLPFWFQPQHRRHRVFGRENLPFGEQAQDFIDGRPRHRRH